MSSLEEELRTTRTDFEEDVRAFELSMRGAMQRLTQRHLQRGIDGDMWGPANAFGVAGAFGGAGASTSTPQSLASLNERHSSSGDGGGTPTPTVPPLGLAMNCAASGHESINFLASIDFNPPRCECSQQRIVTSIYRYRLLKYIHLVLINLARVFGWGPCSQPLFCIGDW